MFLKLNGELNTAQTCQVIITARLLCKNFENLLSFNKVTESLKVGTFFETQCRNVIM